MFKEIQSKDNKLIKSIKKYKEKKYRNIDGRFIVEGWKLVEEAIRANWEIDYIFFDEREIKKAEIIQNTFKVSEDIIKVSNDIIKTLSSTDHPQGILAVVKKKIPQLSIKEGFYVLIDKVQDPGNMGTIIRSAHASGAKGIILTKGSVDIYNDKVLRSTMGSMFHIPIFEEVDNIIDILKTKNYRFLVSSLQTDKNFYEEDLRGNIVICVGNEGNGISDDIYKLADIKVKIPMPGGAESLNVSVASSIMMFEVVRQNLS